MTTRFIFKALALFVISGGIFWYYLTTMRQDGNHAMDRPFTIASAIVVIGCVVWGFSGIGSPYYERQLAFDLRRENDMMSIEGDNREQYSKDGAIPHTTNEKDPESGKPYEYRITGKSTYVVCATFDTDRPATTDSDWTHHKDGRVCFTLDASKRQP